MLLEHPVSGSAETTKDALVGGYTVTGILGVGTVTAEPTEEIAVVVITTGSHFEVDGLFSSISLSLNLQTGLMCPFFLPNPKSCFLSFCRSIVFFLGIGVRVR